MPIHKIILPYKELCRHFDGYGHVPAYLGGPITNNQCPSIEIPPGFFENKIKIRYGFDDYKKDYVNINPKNKIYRASSEIGTDYRFTIKDIPIF